MGDGTLIQFDSTRDALNCAREIQKQVNLNLDFKIRIGIHLGDITIENNDIYGDGVNIASRIESIAEPGSIYISEAVQGAVKGTGDFNFQYLGEKKLKHVERPVRIYKLVSEKRQESLIEKARRKVLFPSIIFLLIAVAIWRFLIIRSSAEELTVLVLPFEYTEQDTSSSYLKYAITEELIRNLGKVTSIKVLNPQTAYVFEASLSPLTDANQRLENIDFFVKGSLEIENSQVRLLLDLFDRKENNVWSRQYQDDATKLPTLTGKIAIDLSENIVKKIKESDLERITNIKPIDPEIYEFWLKAWNEVNKGNAESFLRAKVYLNEATDRSLGDARTWATKAEALVTMGHSRSSPAGVWEEAQAAADRALQLDSLNAEAWAALAHSKTYYEWDYEGAEAGYRKANSLNPSIAINHYHYAWHLYLHDRLDEAIQEHTLAQKLDPLQPGHTHWLARLYVENGEFDKAMIEINRAFGISNENRSAIRILGDIYLAQEKYDSALYAYEKGKDDRGMALSYFRSGQITKGMEVLDRMLSRPLNARRALLRACVYAEIDSVDQFFQYASYEPHAYSLPWLRKRIKSPSVIEDPRYREFMNKMNLPMPQGYE